MYRSTIDLPSVSHTPYLIVTAQRTRNVKTPLNGTWQGVYRYGLVYGSVASRLVPFNMSLTHTPEDDGLAGYARDRRLIGSAERGRIHGITLRGLVEFTRSTPITPDHGREPSDEFTRMINAKLGVVVVQKSFQHVLFRGEVSDSGTTISGDWQVLAVEVTTTDGHFRIPTPGSGTWRARRVSRRPSAV